MNERCPKNARKHRLALLIGLTPLLLAGCCQFCDQPPEDCPHPPNHGSAKLDASGKPLVDDSGCPVYEQCEAKPANAGNPQVDASGKPLVDDSGCPVYEQCAKPANAGNPQVDASGKPLVDDSGCTVYSDCPVIEGATQTVDAEGNPMFSAQGCPLYQTP